MASSVPSLLVSIHDVSPKFEGQVDRLADIVNGGEIQHALILFQQEIQNEDREFRPRGHGAQARHIAARLRQQRLDQFRLGRDMGKPGIGNVARLLSRHRISIFFPKVTDF